MKIAVDFDGTIVEHRYPAIGEVKPFAFETLRELQKKGHQLIMWTYRWGKELDEAVEFCKKHGLEFYAVNKNYPEEQFSEEECSRKLDVDLFIDDRNIGGFVEWSEVWRILHGDNPLFDEENNPYAVQHKKTSLRRRLFGRK
ncbi:MAG: hypothetical protein LBU90_02235 [Bacteroidales bacterium]|jgi:hypothetical protein|nr:hypothetical protein [Bacteroidales bacterium]